VVNKTKSLAGWVAVGAVMIQAQRSPEKLRQWWRPTTPFFLFIFLLIAGMAFAKWHLGPRVYTLRAPDVLGDSVHPMKNVKLASTKCRTPYILLRQSGIDRLLSRLVGWLADRTVPESLRAVVFGLFAGMFGINLKECRPDVEHFPTVNAFFSRPLLPGLRPISNTPLVSPVDGFVNACGKVENNELHQIKGVTFYLGSFLGTFPEVSHQLYYAVFYLSPKNYHRFHSPTRCSFETARHFPGSLLPVKPDVVKGYPGLFAANERIVLFGTWDKGRSLGEDETPPFFSYTAVGATNVGSIELHPELRPEIGSRGNPSRPKRDSVSASPTISNETSPLASTRSSAVRPGGVQLRRSSSAPSGLHLEGLSPPNADSKPTTPLPSPTCANCSVGRIRKGLTKQAKRITRSVGRTGKRVFRFMKKASRFPKWEQHIDWELGSDDDGGVSFDPGDEIGLFRLGASSVVIVFESQEEPTFHVGPGDEVKLGQPLVTLPPRRPPDHKRSTSAPPPMFRFPSPREASPHLRASPPPRG